MEWIYRYFEFDHVFVTVNHRCSIEAWTLVISKQEKWKPLAWRCRRGGCNCFIDIRPQLSAVNGWMNQIAMNQFDRFDWNWKKFELFILTCPAKDARARASTKVLFHRVFASAAAAAAALIIFCILWRCIQSCSCYCFMFFASFSEHFVLRHVHFSFCFRSLQFAGLPFLTQHGCTHTHFVSMCITMCTRRTSSCFESPAQTHAISSRANKLSYVRVQRENAKWVSKRDGHTWDTVWSFHAIRMSENVNSLKLRRLLSSHSHCKVSLAQFEHFFVRCVWVWVLSKEVSSILEADWCAAPHKYDEKWFIWKFFPTIQMLNWICFFYFDIETTESEKSWKIYLTLIELLLLVAVAAAIPVAMATPMTWQTSLFNVHFINITRYRRSLFNTISWHILTNRFCQRRLLVHTD